MPDAGTTARLRRPTPRVDRLAVKNGRHRLRKSVRPTDRAEEEIRKRIPGSALMRTAVPYLELCADYSAFERRLRSEFKARTAIRRELVTRLASLLWRLRRAVAIESELLRIQAGIIRERRLERLNESKRFIDLSKSPKVQREPLPEVNIAHSFLRLINFNEGVLETLGHYESRLWRQACQTIKLLNSV